MKTSQILVTSKIYCFVYSGILTWKNDCKLDIPIFLTQTLENN